MLRNSLHLIHCLFLLVNYLGLLNDLKEPQSMSCFYLNSDLLLLHG